MTFSQLKLSRRFCIQRYVLIMITAWILLSNSRAVYAHEISPSVADLTINGNSVSLTINLNVESFVAQIDLQSLDRSACT